MQRTCVNTKLVSPNDVLYLYIVDAYIHVSYSFVVFLSPLINGACSSKRLRKKRENVIFMQTAVHRFRRSAQGPEARREYGRVIVCQQTSFALLHPGVFTKF